MNLVFQVPQVNLVPPAHLAHQECLERMVLDTPVRLVHLDHQVQQDTPHLVNLEAQVHLENQVHLDIQVRRDIQGLQDLKVQEERQDHLEPLDLLAFLLPESLDHTVFQEQWAHVENLA